MFDVSEYLDKPIISVYEVHNEIAFGWSIVGFVLCIDLGLFEGIEWVVLVPPSDYLLLRFHYVIWSI